MKYCPQCQKQYTENWITFCSDDGAILVDTEYSPSHQPSSQRPPYAPPLSEQPTWRSPDPNAPGGWVSPGQPSPSPVWQPPPPPYSVQQPGQGLSIASMVIGLISFAGGICLGPIPGLIALILGLVSLSQIKRDPTRYGGKPLAIIGVITGTVSLVIFGILMFFWILGAVFSS